MWCERGSQFEFPYDVPFCPAVLLAVFLLGPLLRAQPLRRLRGVLRLLLRDAEVRLVLSVADMLQQLEFLQIDHALDTASSGAITGYGLS